MASLKKMIRQINDILASLLENELALDYNAAIERPEGNYSVITWAGAPERPSTLLGPQFGSIREYRSIVSKRSYSCMLSDGGIIQIGYLLRDNDIHRHRLAFFPCPIQLLPSDIDSIQAGDDLVSLLDSLLEREGEAIDGLEDENPAPGSSRLRLRTPIRFDFDLQAQAERHPASHLHIQESDCRIAVFGPLSVAHFIRFLFRNFYPSCWDSNRFLQDLENEFCGRHVTDDEETDLFIDCR